MISMKLTGSCKATLPARHYSDQIAQVAELVVKNRELSPVVLLSGPSGSSKTTSGRRLRDLLIAQDISAHLVSMDNYYLPWSAPDFPMTPDGQRDLEAPGWISPCSTSILLCWSGENPSTSPFTVSPSIPDWRGEVFIWTLPREMCSFLRVFTP